MNRGPQHNLVGQSSVTHLALLAMMITQTFRYANHWSAWVVLAESIITLGLVFGLPRLLQVWSKRLNTPARRLLLLQLVMVIFPLLVQVVTRSLEIGDPNELVLLIIVQNVALALAKAPTSQKSLQIAGLLSGFLVLFVTSMTDHYLVWAGSALFSALGLWWLMCSYWARLETKFATSSDRKIPLRPVLIAVSLLVGLGVLSIAVIGVPRTAMVLSGFMPTSGGDKYQDGNARSGVGEGDMMIAAEDSAFSFGPVDSEIFLESKMPSLYDVASDQYGEARVKKQINQELNQSIAITGDRLRHNHQKKSSSEQATRQFSTLRRLTKQRQVTPEDRKSTALFQVSGDSPLHLMTQRFDTFDGVDWTHSGNKSIPFRTSITSVNGKPWVKFQRNETDVLRGKQRSTLRIINLKSKQIPSPAHVTGIHIADVDRDSFYTTGSDGVLELAAQEFIPRLTVIHLISQTHSISELTKLGDFRGVYSPRVEKSLNSSVVPGKLAESLARRWTANSRPGWEQVVALTQNLRGQYKHDHLETAPEDCQNVVDHFLKTKRGPDYMFASAATQMLRSLGYEAQLVLGFYADSRDFDSQSRQSIINSENLHFWTEVHVGQNVWIPIEPTPGYQDPKNWLTWQEYLSMAWTSFWTWIQSNSSVLLSVAIGFTFLYRLRYRIIDIGSFALWRICWFGTSRRRIIWTIRILEFRARMAGQQRPDSKTLSKWYLALAEGEPSLHMNCGPLEQVIALADQAFYGPALTVSNQTVPGQMGMYAACFKLLSSWTSRKMKRSKRDLDPKSIIGK